MGSYGRRKGQAWARRHPKGSAILGIVFGLLLTIAFFAAKYTVPAVLAGCYTAYCLYLLFAKS